MSNWLINVDEDPLELAYWTFDEARKPGDERLRFKEALRAYARQQIVADRAGLLTSTDIDTSSVTYACKLTRIEQDAYLNNPVAYWMNMRYHHLLQLVRQDILHVADIERSVSLVVALKTNLDEALAKYNDSPRFTLTGNKTIILVGARIDEQVRDLVTRTKAQTIDFFVSQNNSIRGYLLPTVDNALILYSNAVSIAADPYEILIFKGY